MLMPHRRLNLVSACFSFLLYQKYRIHSIKKGNKALSFLTERSVVQESPVCIGDSCIRRNDIICKKVSLPLNIEWIQKIYHNLHEKNKNN